MKNAFKFMAACAILTAAATPFAQDSAALPGVEAEVRKVDTESQKITLRHGEIPNIGMGAMTMVFRLKDPALLRQVKPGDRVTVTIDRVEGALTVMSMEAAKP